MANDGHIHVKSGLQPTHSFDLFGPVVKGEKLGALALEAFKENAEGNIPEDDYRNRISNYEALERGEDWATGSRKREIISAVLEFVDEDALDYTGVFQNDWKDTANQIVDAGEGIVVFTSMVPKWLDRELQRYDPGLAERLAAVHVGGKTNPGEYLRVSAEEQVAGRQMVSHTADELPELVGAVQSGLDLKLAYINRNDSNTRETVTAAGVHYFVDDLKEVPYTEMVRLK